MTAAAEIPAVVLGATGYVGGEFLRLLSLSGGSGGHPHFRLQACASRGDAGTAIATVFPHLAPAVGDRAFVAPGKALDAVDRGAPAAIFSAAPHGAAAAMIADALEAAGRRNVDARVVDCSADFRYDRPSAYEAVYGAPHGAPALLGNFSCAVPEHARGPAARHVGHPGCFATAVLLAAVPLAAARIAPPKLYVSAITGSTGSGRTPQRGTHHPERHANLYAYKPLAHRHVPEVERLIAAATGEEVKVRFVPHSGPFARGIYATLLADADPAAADGLREAFERYYADCEFVRVLDSPPKLKDVVTTNYAHIGVTATPGGVAVMCAIDNLVKGAAGGALQWMNRLWSLPEAAGLSGTAPGWT